MIKIGVICEGDTDFAAIEHFFGNALITKKIDVKFVDLQPNLDQTQPKAGWGHVAQWFEQNKPADRVRRFFGGGLFDNDLDVKSCDLFLVQLDADILGEDSFGSFNLRKFQLDVLNPALPSERGDEIKRILAHWSGLTELTQADVERHVLAPAVESTETWCVGAFRRWQRDIEAIVGDDLAREFTNVLLKSEGRPIIRFASSMDKNVGRRKRYCRRHASGHAHLVLNCKHFAETLLSLERLAERVLQS